MTFFLCASRRPPKGPRTAQQTPNISREAAEEASNKGRRQNTKKASRKKGHRRPCGDLFSWCLSAFPEVPKKLPGARSKAPS